MLKIGIVGARGLSTIMGFKASEDVEVQALCDLNQEVLDENCKKFNVPNSYRIYDDMLASDIDAVVIATPMQLHVPQAIVALEAGKHVLCEVTAAVSMDELWWLKEAVEKSKKVYMYAENYCYIPYCQQIRNMVKAGLFGEVYYGECEYLHNIKSLMKYSNGATSWRSYWQLGKRGNFYPTHSLGPIMQWFEGDHISSISCFTAGLHNGLRQDDTTVTMCQLKSGKLVTLRLDCTSNRPHNMCGYQLQGTKGAFESAREKGARNIVWLDNLGEDVDHAKWRDLHEFDSFLPKMYQEATTEQRNAGHLGGDYFIVRDFVDAIKGKKKPEINVYQACEWTAVGLLSELSVMNRGKTIDVPDFRSGKITEQEIKL